MNKSQSLQVSLSSASTSEAGRRFVNLTQRAETGMDKTASMFDIAQMVALARSGHTAHLYKKDACPAGVTSTGVNVHLPFEAWPSSLDFDYTLTANIGKISSPTVLDEYTEFSINFDKKNEVKLDFALASIQSYEWETPCYTPKGQTLPNQVLHLEDMSVLRTDEIIWGVVRIKGKKIGAVHVLNHTLIKSYPERPGEPLPDEDITAEDLENYWGFTNVETWNGQSVDPDETVNQSGYSIENLSITITAEWTNIKGKKEHNSMRLEIPQCVVDFLSNCDGDPDALGGPETTICPDKEDDQLTVYYSACTGEVIDERQKEKDPDNWCE